MHQRERTARLHESARLKQVWFPDDEAAHARIDDFFDNWQSPDEPIEEPKQVEELVQEQDVYVEIVR